MPTPNRKSPTQARSQTGLENVELLKVYQAVTRRTGLDLRHYKPATIRRRIAMRLSTLKLKSLSDYAAYIRKNASEAEFLANDVLIRVTGFFRDPEVFKALQSRVLPSLVKNATASKPVRVWVPGCCTGEEVYSIAMALAEVSGDGGPLHAQIFGTDVSEPALATARAGVYPERAVKGMSRERLERFFQRTASGWQIDKGLRAQCTFAKQDLAQDPPFSRMDLISCRNVLIYLGAELQNRIFPVFHYALNRSGYLLLGKSETIGSLTNLFEAYDRRNNVYRRRETASRPEISYHVLSTVASTNGSSAAKKAARAPREIDFQRELEKTVLARYAPAAVLVNSAFDVVKVRGEVAPYLRIPLGKMTFNLLKMARENLSLELGFLLERARRRSSPQRSGLLQDAAGGRFTVEVLPLKGVPQKDRHYLVVFEPAPKAGGGKAPARADAPGLREEYERLRDYLQSVIEREELMQQELRAANEEVLSSNEELQSMNEELRTSKEELESANEELTTVNEELHARNAQLKASFEELRESRDDMREAQRLAHFGNWRLDTASKRLIWSSELYRIFGVPVDQKIDYDRFTALVHPEDRKRFAAEVEAVLKTGKPMAFEHRIVRPDGQTRLLQVRGRAVEDAAGRVARVIGTGHDITEARQAEDRLRASEERFRLLVESVKDYAIFLLDPEGRITTWNAGARRIKGYEAAEIIGKHFSVFYNDQDRASGHPFRELEHALRDGAYREEGWRIRKDGRAFWANVVITTLRDASGRHVGFAKVTRDMTEQRRAAEELRQSEERMTLLVESVKDYAIYQLDPVGHVTSWNSGARNIKGYEAHEIIGKDFSVFYTPEDRAKGRPAKELEKALNEGAYREEEWRVRKDGRRFWASVVITSLRDASGRHVGFAKVVRDLTEQRKATEALRESALRLEEKVLERTRQLENSERFYRFMADSVPQIMWTAAAEGAVDYLNRRWYDYTGLSETESLGWGWAAALHPDDAERAKSDWARAAGERRENFEAEYRFRRAADGEYRWHLARALPLKNENGETVKWFGSCTDIHDAKLTAESLTKKSEELAASNKELEQFAYVASHDLQEPLRKIIAFSDRLKEREIAGMGETERDYFDRMQNAARRMKTLIEDLLNFSRVSTREVPLDTVRPAEIVHEVLVDLEAVLSQSGGKVHVGEIPPVRANGMLLRQLFQNLIGNSLKFAQKKAPPRISVEGWRLPQDMVEIEVRDNGIGFEEKYLDRIFKPFQRLHGRAEYEGTGIGLAICQKIVQRHGGTLTARSRPGDGATFVVRLPAA